MPGVEDEAGQDRGPGREKGGGRACMAGGSERRLQWRLFRYGCDIAAVAQKEKQRQKKGQRQSVKE